MVSSKVAEQYFNLIIAKSKKIVWFENSAHVANDDEPEKFKEEI